MKIGIFLESDLKSGGGFQQALNAADTLNKFNIPKLEIIFFTTQRSNIEELKKQNFQISHLKLTLIVNLLMWLKSKTNHPSIIKKLSLIEDYIGFTKVFKNEGIDIIYFTNPSNLAHYIDNYNFIYTVWDLAHRDNLEFPEVRDNRVFQRREKKYNSIIPRSALVIADSEVGKMNILSRYRIDQERVISIPFSPAKVTLISEEEYQKNFIDIRTKYDLNTEYVFYPAQFWAHKNHLFILEGIHRLESKYDIKIGALFCGADKGNKGYIIKKAAELGISDRITFTGFVKNNEIPYLYRQSIALLMPTFFGPTNLPPLEAFQLGVPVIYSNIKGAKEQLGESVLYLDLYSKDSLPKSIIQLQDETFRSNLIEKGYKQLEVINERRKNGELLFKSF